MTVISRKAFREYDVRGIVGHEITPELAYLIGRAFGAEVRSVQGKSICVGRDGRLSSPELSKNLIQGLLESGLNIYELEVGPTPMTYFAAHTLELDAAIMVTGSHNPGNHNGFKMVLKGNSFWGQRVQDLLRRIESKDFINGQGTHQHYSIVKAYTDYLVDSFMSYYRDQPPLKVAWDPGNGAAADVVSDIVQRLPGQHYVLNGTIDGHFPSHHPDPTVSKNLVQLQEIILKEKCDLGVAFDGDGDRLGVVDGEGTILWGDEFLVLLAEEVLKNHPGATIIADVKASQSFFEAVHQMGGNPLMWKTGHSLIKTKMKETKAPLAGEMSGHIFYSDRYFGFDDGIYAALRLIGICGSLQSSLAEWNRSRPERVNTPEIRISCENHDKFEIVSNITEVLKSKGVTIDLTDGVRVVNEKGWWLLRASNTQDVLVVRAESTSRNDLKILVHNVQECLKPYGIEVNDAA